MSLKAYFSDTDITSFVNTWGTTQEIQTIRNDNFISNQYNLQLNNASNDFTENIPGSLIFGRNWFNDKLEIKKTLSDGMEETIWLGLVKDIIVDTETRKAQIISESALSLLAETKNISTIINSVTPSNAIYTILNSVVGISSNYINLSSFEKANNIYENNGVYINVNYNPNDGSTALQACKQITTTGIGYLYTHNNVIYYDIWQPFAGGEYLELSDSNFVIKPKWQRDVNNIYNAYSINFLSDSGTPITGTDSLSPGYYNITRTFIPDTQTNTIPITIITSAAADYLGKLALQRSRFAKPLIEFETKEDFDFFSIGKYLRLTSTDLNINNEPVAIRQIEKNNETKILKFLIELSEYTENI